MTHKSILFLQGVASPFFHDLAVHFQYCGHTVNKINFCPGDAWFWPDAPAWNFQAPHDDFPAYVAGVFAEHSITDLFLFGDCRPLHKAAIGAAQAANVRVWVFEEGYFRPGLVTFERSGTNANSSLPKTAGDIFKLAETLPEVGPSQGFGTGMRLRVSYDILYNVLNMAQPWRFTHYRTHRPYPIEREYLSWIKRLLTLRIRGSKAKRICADLLAGEQAYFFFPLQLDSDFQIRNHYEGGSMVAAIERVIASFAKHADQNVKLVIKNHPLDNGTIPYRKVIADLARKSAVADRVMLVDGGPLDDLLAQCRGVVVVNSTVGISALEAGRPVYALGKAIYAIENLCSGGSLEEFWRAPSEPAPALFSAFRKVVINATQCAGDFYTPDGRASLLKQCEMRLMETPSA